MLQKHHFWGGSSAPLPSGMTPRRTGKAARLPVSSWANPLCTSWAIKEFRITIYFALTASASRVALPPRIPTMGKKKQRSDVQETPLWVPKKPKISSDEPLSHLNALMQVSPRARNDLSTERSVHISNAFAFVLDSPQSMCTSSSSGRRHSRFFSSRRARETSGESARSSGTVTRWALGRGTRGRPR